MDRKGLAFFHSVIWDKLNPGLGWRYRRQHEMVMIAHREGGRLLWADDKIATPNIFSLMPPRDRVHPNEKPVAFVSHFIEHHSQRGQLICDPFMGSGTTGVSAVRLGRKFLGIEIDREHFDTACRRIDGALKEPTLFDEPRPTATQAEMVW